MHAYTTLMEFILQWGSRVRQMTRLWQEKLQARSPPTSRCSTVASLVLWFLLFPCLPCSFQSFRVTHQADLVPNVTPIPEAHMWRALHCLQYRPQILAPETCFGEDNFSTDGRLGSGDGSGNDASSGEQQLRLYSISSKGSGSGTPRWGDSCVIFQGERVTRGP